MVFHAIKNLFSPSNTHTLYKNNKKLVTATLSIKPHLLTLNHIDIPFNRIYNLKHTTNITFTYQNNQYRLEGNNLQSIYDQFVTLIKPKQLVFNAKNTKYYKSNKLIESDVDVCIYKQNSSYLIIVKDEVLHEEEITDENKYSVEPGGCAFIWTLMHENVPVTFRIEFARQIDYLEYLSKYTKCIMKHEIEENETEQKIESRSYNTANRTYLDSNENISSNAVNSELFASSFHETNEEMSHLFDTSSDESDNKNKDLTVSNQNKAFVTRGSSIGIFDLQNENIDFQSTINLNIDPSKILHHNNNLIVMDDQSNNKLYNVDLERGNITDEWDLNRQITDYFDSQKTQSGDIVALNDNSLFKIDLRTDKKIVSENNYKTKTNFTCGMSSKEGDLVIANKRGDLRLYDNLEKRAKRLLHGLGDEIYSLDSSIDGRYVVCTTHKYLLFYDLSLQEIVPKRLQLRSEHLVYMNDVKFTPAKFNNANNCIVTSSGRFVITWNVSDVDSNIYSIKKCKDVVVADNFTSGENIIVAMPNDVKIVNRKKLKNTDKISKTDK